MVGYFLGGGFVVCFVGGWYGGWFYVVVLLVFYFGYCVFLLWFGFGGWVWVWMGWIIVLMFLNVLGIMVLNYLLVIGF